MVKLHHGLNGIALSLCVLGGCAQNDRLTRSAPLDTQVISFAKLKPGPNPITYTSFSDGRLALKDGCFRLEKSQASMAIVWQESARLVRIGQMVRIEDNAARWSAKIGDRIRLGGKTFDDIATVNLDNKAVLGCVGPYFVASNVIRR
jgi:hypothetical protein